MLKFEDIEDLVSYMFEKTDGDKTVSVVADKDLAVEIMTELLSYEDMILDIAEVDTFDYDKEYVVSLWSELDTDYWHVSIEQAYDYENEQYNPIYYGYVLFHEDVNSKAQIEMKNDMSDNLLCCDWFILGEDKDSELESCNMCRVNKDKVEKNYCDGYNESDDYENYDDNNSKYTITIKCNDDSNDVMKIKKIESDLVYITKMLDEIDRFRRLFRW